MRRLRVRFSSLSALLLTTIVGLLIVVVLQWRELRQVRPELRRLRNEVGELSIGDPSKPHVVRVRTVDEHHWKWRFWIPDGKHYSLKFRARQVPKSGFPTNVAAFEFPQAGEVWIEYRIDPDSAPNSWSDKLSTSVHEYRSDPTELEWMNWKDGARSNTTDVGYYTSAKNPDESILLIRYRASQHATKESQIEEPSDGFIIWLVPKP